MYTTENPRVDGSIPPLGINCNDDDFLTLHKYKCRVIDVKKDLELKLLFLPELN
jgi:hypothetical protein